MPVATPAVPCSPAVCLATPCPEMRSPPLNPGGPGLDCNRQNMVPVFRQKRLSRLLLGHRECGVLARSLSVVSLLESSCSLSCEMPMPLSGHRKGSGTSPRGAPPGSQCRLCPTGGQRSLQTVPPSARVTWLCGPDIWSGGRHAHRARPACFSPDAGSTVKYCYFTTLIWIIKTCTRMNLKSEILKSKTVTIA